MPNYLNGVPDIEILGSPKTVRLEGTFHGETYSAPMEVWIQALVAILEPEQKTRFFAMIRRVQEHGYYRRIRPAQVVAEIPMPNLEG